MDVDEFLQNFFDTLEKEIKLNQEQNIIKQNFGGTLSNEVIGKSCPHSSERQEE